MMALSVLFRMFINIHDIGSRIDINKRRQGYGDNKRYIYRNEEPMDYLVCQFDFSKSNEGFEYWNELNEQWLDFLEENSE